MPEPTCPVTVTVTASPLDAVAGIAPIQLGSELTAQLQPVGPVTATRWLPPAAVKLSVGGATVTAQLSTAGCSTSTRALPIVTMPDRRVEPGFASTPMPNRPGDAVEATLIQVSLAVTTQLQPRPPETVTDSLPADAVKLSERGITLAAQPDSWPTLTLTPPIVTVPDLAGSSLASTPMANRPGDAVEATLIQVSLATTFQLQPRPPETVTDLLPADAVKLSERGITLEGGPQGGSVCPPCWMSTSTPPIVTLPDLADSSLACTPMANRPGDAVETTLIQLSLALTPQLQPRPPDTVTDLLPADAVKLSERGTTLAAQPDSWPTLTLTPPIVTVPDLAGSSLASTPMANRPGDAVEATLIQVALAVTSQLQPVSPATVTFRLPVADVNVNLVGVTLVGDA